MKDLIKNWLLFAAIIALGVVLWHANGALLSFFSTPARAGLYERQLTKEIRDSQRWLICLAVRQPPGPGRDFTRAVERRFECEKLLEENLQ